MPSRQRSHPFVTRLGQRFRELRGERGLSLQALTEQPNTGSKGFASQFERGMALPSLLTLDAMARRMGLDVVDLVNFPERGERNRLIELTRGLSDRELRQLQAQAAAYGVRQTRKGRK